MKGMNILNDMILEQIVGGRASVVGDPAGYSYPPNLSSDRTMQVANQAIAGLLTAIDTGNVPIFPGT